MPIYPQSLGHSYHTLIWRLGVEAKEMQPTPASTDSDADEAPNASRNAGETNSNEHDENNSQLDPFYNGREEFRSRDDIALLQRKGMSYLEERRSMC